MPCIHAGGCEANCQITATGLLRLASTPPPLQSTLINDQGTCRHCNHHIGDHADAIIAPVITTSTTMVPSGQHLQYKRVLMQG